MISPTDFDIPDPNLVSPAPHLEIFEESLILKKTGGPGKDGHERESTLRDYRGHRVDQRTSCEEMCFLFIH